MDICPDCLSPFKDHRTACIYKLDIADNRIAALEERVARLERANPKAIIHAAAQAKAGAIRADRREVNLP